MRLRRLVLVGSLIALGGVSSAQSKAVLWPAAAIKWTDSPSVKGAKSAVLWGDPARGAYGALKQIPAGTTLASHSHTRDSHVVIVKGSITLDLDGRKTVVGPGSYTMIPGGLAHATTCGGAAACEYFEHMDGAFDSADAKK